MNKAREVRQDRPRKPTLREIAELAGVGTATVERVLNERGMVAPRTAERVMRAAKTLGVRRPLPRLYKTPIRIEVLLPEPLTPFHRRLDDAFVQSKSVLGSEVIVHRTFVEEARTARMAERIHAAAGTRKGLIVLAPDVPEVVAACNQAIKRRIPVVTLVTQVTTKAEHTHVGIDQYAAGRTAAYFAGGFARAGSAVIVCGHQSIHAHRERVLGFQSLLAERFPGLGVGAIVEGRDDPERTRRYLREYLHRKPAPAVIYDTTSTPPTIGQVLQEFGLAGKIVFVGHELTPETVGLLRERTMTLTIDQNPELHARRSLQILLYRLGHVDVAPPPPSIPFFIVSPENLELYTRLPALTDSSPGFQASPGDGG